MRFASPFLPPTHRRRNAVDPAERACVPAAVRKRVVVLHGPNLNVLGAREPQVYGLTTLRDIDAALRACAKELRCQVFIAQHSSEGDLIDAIHAAAGRRSAIVINPGAYTHYSYAIRDALAAVAVPKVEVHLTNIYSRERFRRRSVMSPVVDGCVLGFGPASYLLAMRAASAMLDEKEINATRRGRKGISAVKQPKPTSVSKALNHLR
jgi:3-dehydroquinate dehydratase-2